MKRVGIILFTLLFVGVLIAVPCFADGYYGYSALDYDHNIRCVLNYSSREDLTSIEYREGTYSYGFLAWDESPYPYSANFTLYNESSSDYYINMYSGSDPVTYSIDGFNLPAGSSVTVTSNYTGSGGAHSWFCSYTVTSGSSYSVFGAGSLISSVGKVLGTITNSSTILLPLFLIGVTLSLGFVAIKFIRKVMWGN